MPLTVRRRASLIVLIALLLAPLVAVVTASGDARAVRIDSRYSDMPFAAAPVTDTQASPGAECTYDLRTGRLKVRVKSPSELRPSWQYSTHRRHARERVEVETLAMSRTAYNSGGGQASSTQELSSKTSAYSITRSQSKIIVGTTRVFDGIPWGYQEVISYSYPELNDGAAVDPIIARVQIGWFDSDSASPYEGSQWGTLIYDMDWYRTTVIDVNGVTRTQVSYGNCAPPYNPVISTSTRDARVGSTIGFTLAGFPANTLVKVIYNWAPGIQLYGTNHQVARVTTDGAGAATGTFKVPVTSWKQNVPISARVVGNFSTVNYVAHVPSMRPIPRSGPPGSSVTYSFASCPMGNTAEVYWKQGSNWTKVASSRVASTGRVEITSRVPSWAPVGTNSLQYHCFDPSDRAAETFTVTAPGSESATVTPTATAETITETPTVLPTIDATATPDATVEPTIEPTATETPLPTETPTPEPTATEAPPETTTPTEVVPLPDESVEEPPTA